MDILFYYFIAIDDEFICALRFIFFKQVIIEGFNSIVKYVFLVSLIIVYFANSHVNIAYNNNVTEL